MNSKTLYASAASSLTLARRVSAVNPTNEHMAQDMRKAFTQHVADARRLRDLARAERRAEMARGFAWR